MKKSHILNLNYLKISALLFVSAIFITPQLAAQEVPYTPFPKGNITWQSWGSLIPGLYPFVPYLLSIDTALAIIESRIYNKVFFDRCPNRERYIGGVREEDKKIYFYVPDAGEHLIYDFGLEIGDTLFQTIHAYIAPKSNGDLQIFFYNPDNHYTYYVAQNRSTKILENGEIRNTLILDRYAQLFWDNDTCFQGTVEWIEGLGCIGGRGFLEILEMLDDDPFFRMIFSLCCINQDNLTLYSNGNCECFQCESNQINEDLCQQITLYPNPATGELRVTSYGLQVTGIEILDVTGKNQKAEGRKQKAESEMVIDISHLQAGSYFVKLITEKGIFVEKIIKK